MAEVKSFDQVLAWQKGLSAPVGTPSSKTSSSYTMYFIIFGVVVILFIIILLIMMNSGKSKSTSPVGILNLMTNPGNTVPAT